MYTFTTDFIIITTNNHLSIYFFNPTSLVLLHLVSDQSLSVERAKTIRHYVRNLKVIDDQRKLSQLSRNIEPWCTTGGSLRQKRTTTVMSHYTTQRISTELPDFLNKVIFCIIINAFWHPFKHLDMLVSFVLARKDVCSLQQGFSLLVFSWRKCFKLKQIFHEELTF